MEARDLHHAFIKDLDLHVSFADLVKNLTAVHACVYCKYGSSFWLTAEAASRTVLRSSHAHV